jgi:hypothetical protein
VASQPNQTAASTPYCAPKVSLCWRELDLIARCLLSLMVAGMTPVLSQQVLADNFWNGPPGATADWQTATNWLTPLLPLQTENVTIANGGSARITSGIGYARNLYFGDDGLSGFLRIEGGELSLSGDFQTGIFVGNGIGSTGGIIQTSGTVRAAGQFQNTAVRVLSIGTGADSVATYDHTGGSLEVQSLRIGSPSGPSEASNVTGTYTLGGTGTLTAGGTNIGKDGSSGSFVMTGGSASLFEVTVASGGSLDISGGTFSTTTRSLNVQGTGSVTLSDGTLNTSSSVLTGNIAGSFVQTGGTHNSASINVSGSYGLSNGTLAVGGNAGLALSGSFTLEGPATLSTTKVTQTAGLFDHVASTHETGILAVNGGTYRMAAGSLSIGSSWTLGSGGTFNFADGSGTVNVAANAAVNLSQGTILNAGNATVNVLGSETLVILPAGFDPQANFGSFNNQGTSYTIGSTLEVLADRTLRLSGAFADPVVVAGTLEASAGASLTLENGLTLQPGGSVSLGSAGAVRYAAGTYAITGGSLATRDLQIATSGTTNFTHSAGTAEARNLSIGTGADSVATYDHTGGSLEVQSLRIGSPSGPSEASNVTGTYTLGGTGTLTAGGTNIGKDGSSGSFVMTGGSASLFEVTVASGGSLDISGGTFSTTTRSLNVQGTGSVTLSDGTLNTSSSVLTGNIAGSFVQTGGTHNSASINVSGSYGLSNGTLAVGGNAGLALSGSFTLEGPATLSTTKVTQTAGLFDHVASTHETGILAVNGGTYRMAAGSLSIGSSWTLGSGGTFNFADGSGTVNVAANAAVNLSQGTILNAGNATVNVLGSETFVVFPRGFDPQAVFGTFSNEGTTYTVGTTLVVQNGRAIDLAGEIDDPIDTAGTVSLTDALVATSDITIRESGRVTGPGSVVVRGGTIRGKGRIETPMQVEGGIVAPGLSPGALIIDGDWTMDANSVLELEIFGTESEQFDRLVVAGSTTLGGTLSVLLGTDLAIGTTLLMIENTSSSPLLGGFGSQSMAVFGQSLYTFDLDYSAGTGNDLALTVVDISPVPEPSTYAMALAGLACGGYLVRRRRRRVARPIEPLAKTNMASSLPRCVKAGYAPAMSRAASRFYARVLAALIVAAAASGSSMGNGVPVVTPLPVDGPDSRAWGVSGDGSVIVGQYGWPSTDPAPKAFRWTLAGSVEFLSTLPDYSSAQAWRVSDNGAVIAGSSYNGLFETNRAVRWTAAGPQNLGILSGSDTSSYTWGLSGDGAVVVGQSTGVGVSNSRAFRWTESSGMQSLGSLLPEGESTARATSQDGSVVVGWSVAPGGLAAFRWTESSGMVALPSPEGLSTVATAVSADGAYTVGIAYRGTGDNPAVRWGPNGSVEVIVGGGNPQPYAVSRNGSLIVGHDSWLQRAFVWTPSIGMVGLEAYLASLGADLTGWSNLVYAGDVSDDGSVIVGTGNYLGATRAFVVTAVPEPSTYVMALAGLACGGYSIFRRRKQA